MGTVGVHKESKKESEGSSAFYGQTAADSGDTVELQTAAVLDKVDALLKEAGTDKSRALNATIWLKDIAADFKGMNGVSLGCARVLSAGI
mgnify:CR=1 FL=1